MAIHDYGDGETYIECAVLGHLENGPPVVNPNWRQLQNKVTDAARAAIPTPPADFHVLYRDSERARVTALRWVVDLELHGPTLHWHDDPPGPSAIRFRLVQQGDGRHQYTGDHTNPMPMGGDLADVITAVFAQRILGPGPVVIPYAGQPDMTFTPEQLVYTRDGSEVSEPYGAVPFGYTFTLDPELGREPSLWIVPAGEGAAGVKVSACVDAEGIRWDDPAALAPPFEPLPPPQLQTYSVTPAAEVTAGWIALVERFQTERSGHGMPRAIGTF